MRRPVTGFISALALATGCASMSAGRNAPVDPRSAMELRGKAQAASAASDLVQCADLYAQAGRVAPPSQRADDDYGAACCYARAGNKDEAFKFLSASIEAGFQEAEWLSTDSDLTSLHDDPRWEGMVAKARAGANAYLKNANVELTQLFEADQADRKGGPNPIDWKAVSARDEARRKRVEEILGQGLARVSVDYYHAAMVFQHGKTPEDFQKSHSLAVKAVEIDPANGRARWLAAAAKDRELMNLGKPQLYGTQFRKVEGRWELYQVDPGVTDAQRAEWDVPPIAEAMRTAEAMNQKAK